MRNISKKELKEILELHEAWLMGGDDEKADLSFADLSGADLRRANLSDVDLSYANLSDVDLSYANLSGAKLCCANLNGANLYKANLSGANLGGADLRGADLRDANLKKVDLSGADLRGADLRGVNLDNVTANELTAGYWPVCPEKGSFIGFKKASHCIVELLVPAEAKRSSSTTRKCRCEFAKVLNITKIDGSQSVLTEVTSNYGGVVYRIGEMVFPTASTRIAGMNAATEFTSSSHGRKPRITKEAFL